MRLVAEDRWEDGTLDSIEVETLQSPEWVAEHRADVGSLVSLPLDLLEMGLPEGMHARVLANDRCPPIASGSGRVVLTTVNHLNAYVFEVTVTDGATDQETIRPTGFHKFFSVDRSAWVSAAELQQGERIRGLSGCLTVSGVRPLPGVHRVYNMTVEGEHVYHVSALGALAHNNGCKGSGKNDAPNRTKIGKFLEGDDGNRSRLGEQ